MRGSIHGNKQNYFCYGVVVNLSGAFYLSKAILPGMRNAGWGRIINTSFYEAKSSEIIDLNGGIHFD